jgi:hypothetical protein
MDRNSRNREKNYVTVGRTEEKAVARAKREKEKRKGKSGGRSGAVGRGEEVLQKAPWL